MKDEALALARATADPARRLNVLREYLQALILRSLHESEAFQALAFVGGTALHFLYDLRRFSEDLDFSQVTGETFAPLKWMGKLKRDLTLAGFETLATWNAHKTVQIGWVRIGGLLKAAGLAELPAQKLSIKLEVDTRPPAGGQCERRVVTRHATFLLQHYDLPSLMAGKLHALVTRAYPKGRDWYDLLWYLSARPPVAPNLVLLQNALDQTAGTGAQDARAWRALVRQQLQRWNMAVLLADVRPFLEHPPDAALLTRENLQILLQD